MGSQSAAKSINKGKAMVPRKIVTGDDYIESLRGRNLKVFLFGERIAEPIDHPMIRPSVNAMAMTYDLALNRPDLGTALSPFTGERVNRFLHIAISAGDLVLQNKMQRRVGRDAAFRGRLPPRRDRTVA
jgi:4-hydroxybutyryl-CoA dehydratase / vinylacetyl-CoA-Delta-isomerase